MNDKKRNLTVAPIWANKTGNLWTCELGDEQLEALKRVGKGGRFVIRPFPEKATKRPSSPDYYLDYMDVETARKYGKKPEQTEVQEADSI